MCMYELQADYTYSTMLFLFLLQTFTGWADPDLSPQGYREVEYAARLLLEGGYDIDMIFTSRLTRAIRSTWVLLQELNQVYLPVFKSWRLNERHYGALQGLCKAETAEQLGTELVQEWRGSLRTRPPAVMPGDAYWPGQERRYADLPTEDIPLTESLLDCMERTVPIWETKISQQLQRGRNVLVVAHANTLRGLVKIIDGIGDDEIQEVAIPSECDLHGEHGHGLILILISSHPHIHLCSFQSIKQQPESQLFTNFLET